LLREAAERIEAEMRRRRSTNRLKDYRPYPKQREFHAAGKFAHERLFMAGNQLGKTLAGAAEWAMHLSGRYPGWWEGKVFDKPPRLWAAGINGKALREGAQKALIGPPEDEGQWGTGWIPKECILSTARARGQVDVLDHVQVRWAAGATSGPTRPIAVSRPTRKGVSPGRGRRSTASGSTRNHRSTSTPKV
jgi:Terminase large subunit, T4likevirus-type, N-terminal